MHFETKRKFFNEKLSKNVYEILIFGGIFEKLKSNYLLLEFVNSFK